MSSELTPGNVVSKAEIPDSINPLTVPEDPTLFAVFAIDAADLRDYGWEN